MTTYKKVRITILIFSLLTLFFTIIEAVQSPKSGMVLIIECLAGIVLIFAPEFIHKVLRIEFPKATIYFYWYFLVISVFLGSCLHLMSKIYFWDKVLHATSPMLLSIIGYGMAVSALKKVSLKEVPVWLIVLFGFCFAGVCGVVWEFWEFSWDWLANMNLQRYQTSAGVKLVGQEALYDTMGDLFVNTVGATIIGIVSIVKANKDASYFKKYQISRK